MSTATPIAKIAIPSPLRRVFDYLIPAHLADKAQLGVRVKVPFGKKQVVGILVDFAEQSDIKRSKLKAVIEYLDTQSLFDSKQLQLLTWAARYYQYPLGEVLHQAIPVALRQGQPAEIILISGWQLTQDGEQIESEKFSRAPKQWQALEVLRQLKATNPKKALSSTAELAVHGIKLAQLDILKEKKLVIEVKANNIKPLNAITVKGPVLNKQQAEAVQSILQQQNSFASFLLQGVTGSGKTEVYLSVLSSLVAGSAQALVLVPEIGLTPQMVARFEERLNCHLAVLHSGLTDKERTQTWLKVKNGDISVLIGTRSAIFAPFRNLKCIVVDESHDPSYKQWEGFKYHARDLALRRAQLENIPVILGSATPSLSSLHNVERQKFTSLRLTERATGASMPAFAVVDMRRAEHEQGIAKSVIKKIAEHLQKDNQVLVFLNRRGYAPNLLCHECGWVPECKRCNTPLTKHLMPPCLQCHHCGKTKPIYKQCPECQSEQLIDIGLGTERVENTLQRIFPHKNIIRIDRDSTRRKGVLENALKNVNAGHADILIGTQMLAKGHHFPNVTLVVMLDIDGGLFSVDFNALEYMAQLVLQVSGRAGREQKPGTVVLQTHQPEHPLLQSLLKEGYFSFAEKLLAERRVAKLPPYHYMALFHASAVDAHAGENFLKDVEHSLLSMCTQYTLQNVSVCSPLPAPIEKRAGRFRWQLIINAEDRKALHQLLAGTLLEIEALSSARKVRWSIDIDPVSIL